ncbi:hypothetical protein STEG23_006281 [Scotinomys teguina]
MNINTDPPRYGRATDSDMAFGCSLSLDVSMAPDDSLGHSDWDGLCGGMALDVHGSYYHMAFGGNRSMDINTDQGYGRATDPDMVLGSSPGLDVTVAPDGTFVPNIIISRKHLGAPGLQKQSGGEAGKPAKMAALADVTRSHSQTHTLDLLEFPTSASPDKDAESLDKIIELIELHLAADAMQGAKQFPRMLILLATMRCMALAVSMVIATVAVISSGHGSFDV